VGKRNTENTTEFLYDLRERVLGAPEISTDGFLPYRNAIRDTFHNRAAHGVVVKTYSVTNLAKQAAVRYSPAQVVAVTRDAVSGVPAEILTSYVERQNLTLRMSSRRFTRLTNGFSKKLDHHCAAVSLTDPHRPCLNGGRGELSSRNNASVATWKSISKAIGAHATYAICTSVAAESKKSRKINRPLVQIRQNCNKQQ
jgi:IS1 family transposase